MFEKNWSEVEVKFNWKNTPDNFYNWYSAYMASQKLATPRQQCEDDDTATVDSCDVNKDKIVSGDSYFRARKSVLHKDVWNYIKDIDETPEGDRTQELFTKITNPVDKSQVFECIVNFDNTYKTDKVGALRLTLQQDFLHSIYPRLYALAMMSKDLMMPIPNEPYTPIAEELTISYNAEETISIKTQSLPIDKDNPLHDENNADTFESKRIQLFHEHPFGLTEEHNYLKVTRYQQGIQSVYDEEAFETHLVPKYCLGGELFIGLTNAQPEQTVSLLIQVLEGSENPLVLSFEENENVHWSVLCNNGWKDLKDNILANNTENFLSSGIIQIRLPKEASQNNTLLPQNHIWLRAKIHKSYDVVCKVLDIHSQAVLGEFQDSNNELSHLAEGLAAKTIKNDNSYSANSICKTTLQLVWRNL